MFWTVRGANAIIALRCCRLATGSRITGQIGDRRHDHPHLCRAPGARPAAASGKRYSFPVESFFIGRRGLRFGFQIWAGRGPRRVPIATILLIPLSARQFNLEPAWASDCAGGIPRRCPVCDRDSIVGHGHRRKQAHDEHHDWIQIRRGICNCCGKTFTFLPPFSLPYTHYSLLARGQALRLYFVEHCSLEAAAPTVMNPDRVADPSTLRRWFRSLDSSQPSFWFLRRTLTAVARFLARGESIRHDALPLSWPTMALFLQLFWPLRL